MKEKEFVQSVSNDNGDIEFGEKLKNLLQTAKDDIDVNYVKVKLPNGMEVTVPRGNDKAVGDKLENMLVNVPEECVGDEVNAEEKNLFYAADGGVIDLGPGPAKSDYKPGQLRHLQKLRYKLDRKMNFKNACNLPLHLALVVPFVVIWRKIVNLAMMVGMYAPIK